jgi:hypothetical protein
MKYIYTYGLEKTRRNLTLPDIQANKVAGKKMTQATATMGEEVAAVESVSVGMSPGEHSRLTEALDKY